MVQGKIVKFDTYGVEGPELRVRRAGHSGSQNPVIFALCYESSLPYPLISLGFFSHSLRVLV